MLISARCPTLVDRQSQHLAPTCPSLRLPPQRFARRYRERQPYVMPSFLEPCRTDRLVLFQATGRRACWIRERRREGSSDDRDATDRCTFRRPDEDPDRCACYPTGMDGHRQTPLPRSNARNATSQPGTDESSASGSYSNLRGYTHRVPPTAAQCTVFRL